VLSSLFFLILLLGLRVLSRLRLPFAVLLLVACDPRDDDDGAVDGPSWSVVFPALDGALFSIWGTAADDVWTVGSDAGDGPLVLHWDGSRWDRISTGTTGDLWWVHATAQRVWMCGDGGTVLRHDRGTGTTEIIDTPTDLLMFGVHEIAPGEVWAVGGDPIQQGGVVLRLEGDAFGQLEVPTEAENGSFFKVWGATPDDVWIVGHGGKALHWDGASLSAVDVPQGRPLLTVHGVGDDVVAVGGFASGLLVHVQGGQLVDVTPPAAPQVNGVFVTPHQTAWAAGTHGAILERIDGAWTMLEDVPRLSQDYHAVYADPDGGVWAVGGDIVAPPYRRGVLTYFGEAAVDAKGAP
jgi:hypothetical protein